MAKRVAELFVEVLASAGVKRIYGVAGDSLNGITDSVRRRTVSNGSGYDTRRPQPLPLGPRLR